MNQGLKDGEKISEGGQRGLWQGVPYRWTDQGSCWRRLQGHLKSYCQSESDGDVWTAISRLVVTVHWATNGQICLRNVFKATAQQKKVSGHLKGGAFIMACFYLSFLFLGGSIAKGWLCMGPKWNAATVEEHKETRKLRAIRTSHLGVKRFWASQKPGEKAPRCSIGKHGTILWAWKQILSLVVLQKKEEERIVSKTWSWLCCDFPGVQESNLKCFSKCPNLARARSSNDKH